MEYQRSTLFQATPASQAESEYQQVEMQFFGEMQNTFQQYADKSSAKVGEYAGMRDAAEATRTVTDENGNQVEVPELKESPFAGLTAYGDAYNQASTAAYELRLEGDFVDISSRLKLENPTDLQGFDNASKAFEKSYFKGMRADEALRAQALWGQYKQKARGAVQAAEQQQVFQQSIATIYASRGDFSSRAIDAAGSGDIEGAMAFAQKADEIASELVRLGENPRTMSTDAQTLRKEIEKSFILGGAEKFIAENNYEDALNLTKTHKFQYLDKEDQRNLQRKIRQSIDDNEYKDKIDELEMTREEMKARDRKAGDLELRAARGQATGAEIDKAADDNIITEAKRVQLHLKRDKVLADNQKETSRIERVSAARKAGERLDRGTPDDVKDADAAWQSEFNGVDPLGEGMGSAVAFVDQVGIAPKPLQKRLRQALNNRDNPEAAIAAAEFVDLVRANDPQVMDAFKEGELAIAIAVADAKKTGTDPMLAYQMAYANAYPDNPEVHDALIETYKDEHKEANVAALNGFLDDPRFDPSWRVAQPEASAKMQAEFDAKTESYFKYLNDIDLARQNAWNDITRVWSATEVDGVRRVMKYSPESDRRDLNPEWIKNQFVEDFGPNAVLVADGLTARQKQGQRTWAVRIIDPQTGIPTDEVDRFKPNLSTMKEYKRQVAEELKKEIRIRQEQEAFLKGEEYEVPEELLPGTPEERAKRKAVQEQANRYHGNFSL